MRASPAVGHESEQNGRWRYAGSLLPAAKSLSNVHLIRIKTTTTIDASTKARRLPHENDTNTHDFKPVYVRSDEPGVLDCYVATHFAQQHTLAAWRLRESVVGTGIRIEASQDSKGALDEEYQSLATELVEKLRVGDVVLFGRLETALTFFRKRALSLRGVGNSVLDKLFVDLEKSRYGFGTKRSPFGIYREHLGDDLAGTVWREVPANPIKAGSFLSGQSLTISSQYATVINLPWGRDLSRFLGEAVIASGARKLYMVGGMGYLGEHAGVDDMFAPTSVGTLEDRSSARLVDLASHAKDVSETYGKRMDSGSLLCVDSSFDTPPNFATSLKEETDIRGLDMESSGFHESVRKAATDCQFGILGYIMDKPLSGLSLGDTYYNPEFLERLISSVDRGKNACFEAVIRHIGL